MFKKIAVVIIGAGLLAACNQEPDPYLSKSDTHGTPSDRTGGAAAPAAANSESTPAPAPGH